MKWSKKILSVMIICAVGVSTATGESTVADNNQTNKLLHATKSLQTKIGKIVSDAQKSFNAKEVLVMIMESQSGHLLVHANSNPQSNSYVSFAYEPGAVMMPLTMAVALDAGKVQYDEQIDLHGGSIKVGKFTVTDSVNASHKSFSMTDVITHSSNVGIVQIAQRLSGVELGAGLRGFGLGSTAGIELPAAHSGTLKRDAQLQRALYRTTIAYGYGVTATPIQLMRAYASISNGGILPVVYIADSLSTPPTRAISFATGKEVFGMLVANVKKGSGIKAAVAGLIVGGKTGTAHIAQNGRYVKSYNSSFFGFVKDRAGHNYTVGVLVREPEVEYLASNTAVPLFRKAVLALKDAGLLKVHTSSSLSFSSPLQACRVVHRYGRYEDADYNLTIMRDYVTLAPLHRNAKVHAVEEGRVAFAGNHPMLGKTVVLVHTDTKWQSVYAGLDSVDLSVTKGTILSKDAVIGSVGEKMVFQLLYDKTFVDPDQFVDFNANP